MSDAKIVETLKEMIVFYEEMHDFPLYMDDITMCAFGVFSNSNSWNDLNQQLSMISCELNSDFLDYNSKINRKNNSILNIFMNLISSRHSGLDNWLSSKQWLQEAKDMLKYIEDELINIGD